VSRAILLVRSVFFAVVIGMSGAAGLLADNLQPARAEAVGLRVGKPLGGDLAGCLAAIRGEAQASPATSSGTDILLRVEIPGGYTAVACDGLADSLCDDTGARLNTRLTARVCGEDAPGGECRAAWIIIHSEAIPSRNAKSLDGTAMVPLFVAPAKVFKTLDGQCRAGTILASPRVQCRILSREPEDRNLGGNPSKLAQKNGTDLLTFELSSPGARNLVRTAGDVRGRVVNYDVMRQNQRILLSRIEVVESLGGRVLGEVKDVDSDPHSTTTHTMRIPSSTGNIRLRFSFFEKERQVLLPINYSTGLGLSEKNGQ